MLGKLIKHEFKASGRTMLPFILVCLALSVLAGFSARGLEMQYEYSWFTVVFGIVIFLFVAGLIAVCVMALVVSIERFRKNLLGDEGYLMFTLPVSVDQHIFSKLIVSSAWFVLTWLVCVLAMFLMMATNLDKIEVNWADFGYFMTQLWDELVNFGLMHLLGYFLEVLLLAFLGCCVTCLHFYCAMSIGYSFSNHKVLLSVVFFFLISVVASVLQTSFASMTGNLGAMDTVMGSFENMSNAGVVHIVLLAVALYELVCSALLYIPTRLLLKHRLNLP